MEQTNNKSLAVLYDDLFSFRKEHSVKRLLYSDKEWTYYSCGKGKDTIIILPGGIGTGEAGFCYIQGLEKKHKIISPIYPAINTIEELVEGLNKIIETETAEHITLFGASYGGILAQCFMKKYSNKIEKLVLAHTSTITVDYPKEELKDMINLLNKNIKLIKASPTLVMRSILSKKYSQLSKKMMGEEKFWREYFEEVVRTYKKEDIISSLQSMLDFIYKYKFENGFLNSWNGKILILEADDDHAFSEKQKECLKLLYKNARVHTEHGFGHLTSFVKRDLYIKLIEEFSAAG